MRFANPEYLWLFLLLPLMGIYLIYMRESDLPSFRFSSVRLLKNSQETINFHLRLWMTGMFRIVAMAFLILAMARPQKGIRSEEMTAKATDIMICLDASRSMFTIDFKPQNRFEVAKTVIQDFIKGREYDRLGLVGFAEHALTLCPLTLDKSALLSVLDQLKVGAIPPDQTAIGIGIATSVNRIKSSIAKSKIIILVTDGSNNAGSIDPITAAKTAAALKIKIYTIGAGSPEGGLMPIDDPMLGTRMVQVRSDLDEDMLLRIAEETGGKYFRAKNSDGLKTIFKEIDALEKTDIKTKEYVDYEERYVWFLMVGLLFIFIELTLNKTLLRTLP